MLNSITLQNYKSFRNETELKMNPLTVLCGVNSSGKSSIIKSLLVLAQSYRNAGSENSILLNGEYVSEGTFSDISYERNGQDVNISNEFVLYRPTGQNRRTREEVRSFKLLAKIYPKTNGIKSISVNNTLTIGVKNKQNINIIKQQSIVLTIRYKDGTVTETTVEMTQRDQNKRYDISLINFPYRDNSSITLENIKIKNTTCYFNNSCIYNAYSDKIEPSRFKTSNVLINIYDIFSVLSMQYKNISYLTPLRVYPQRNYILNHEISDVGLSGEFTAQIIAKMEEKESNLLFLPPNGDSTPQKYPLSYAINKWLEYFEFGQYNVSKAMESLQFNISNYNISNVGFGISQILPILVKGLLMHENELLLLEQPEIHLHPKSQMAMADFLIEMVKAGKRVLVETHSDHIINRLLRRTLEDDTNKLKDELIKIDFISNNEHENGRYSSVQELEVDSIRGFVNAPEDFFSQFGAETTAIFNVGLQNMRRGRHEN